MSVNLHEIASLVGFEVVNIDDGFTNYEYNVKLASFESLSFLITIKDKLSFAETKTTLYAIVDVLPNKLKKKIYCPCNQKQYCKFIFDNLLCHVLHHPTFLPVKPKSL